MWIGDDGGPSAQMKICRQAKVDEGLRRRCNVEHELQIHIFFPEKIIQTKNDDTRVLQRVLLDLESET